MGEKCGAFTQVGKVCSKFVEMTAKTSSVVLFGALLIEALSIKPV
jgi:hypothetical protein